MNALPNKSIEDVLDFYLKEIEEIHPGMLCSVLRLRGDRLYNWSAPSLPQRYRDAIEGVQIGDNKGSCGTAAYRKEKVVVVNIENDLRWIDYKDLALREGLQMGIAVWALRKRAALSARRWRLGVWTPG